jgi:hypothetical protein
MWDLRQDPRIVNVFAQIWNTPELIVSMDGMSFMCPPEIREGYCDPWPHVDQSINRRGDGAMHNNNPPLGFESESVLITKPFTVQGQFLFEDSFAGDGGFYCIPKSHLKFNEFAPQLEEAGSFEIPRAERAKRRQDVLHAFFIEGTDESGNPYKWQHIAAPRGSLILWDSRTVHWNQHASKNRPYQSEPRVRMVGYLCYVPKARLTGEGRERRREAFEKGVSTGHNPVHPDLKYTKDHIGEGCEQYIEDSGYVHPQIILGPVGEALLG